MSIELNYYGAEKGGVSVSSSDYPRIHTPQELYTALWDIWSAETCAERLRPEWSKANRTLGQCSITAFLAQDIFGGLVRGIPLPDGSVHCFNDVNGVLFDLTSEQCGNEKLCYEACPVQDRAVHFANAEKYGRYLMLCSALRDYQHMNTVGGSNIMSKENLSGTEFSDNELSQVSGGADHGGVILVTSTGDYFCSHPGCGMRFETEHQLRAHIESAHYEAVIL